VPLALSTGHEVGLGVTGLVFILFALASSFLFPRFRPDYPGHGLLAFIVVAFVFFFGMLAAVEVFGAETKHNAEGAPAETTTAPAETTTAQSATTTTPAKPAATKVPVSETEFKIVAGSTDLKAGEITFEVKNDGKLGHDLAIKETGDKTKLIPVGGTAELKVTLKAGKYELYCTVPGHEAAGMKLNITVQQTTTRPAVGQTSTQSTTTTPAKPAATKVPVSETEFKIVAGSTDLKAGEITFEAKNDGKLPHDLAIKETGDKTKLIPVGDTAELKVTLKAGKYELYCTVPGHEAAGMKLNITVS
jgi:uncharacterized cupredoxin-like copper-binding protein